MKGGTYYVVAIDCEPDEARKEFHREITRTEKKGYVAMTAEEEEAAREKFSASSAAVVIGTSASASSGSSDSPSASVMAA
jgi:hypothetical protein